MKFLVISNALVCFFTIKATGSWFFAEYVFEHKLSYDVVPRLKF